MNFFRFGRGKDPLVILPGLSVQSVMLFADAVAESYRSLADRYTVYVFDRRKELPAAYSVHDMARDTAQALSALNLRRVSVFGASQGGMIAMVIAIEHPEIVEKLILGSTSAKVSGDRFQTIEHWIQLAKAGNAEELYLSFGKAIYPENVFEGSRDALLFAAQTVTAEDLSRFVVLAEAVRGFDITDDLQKIACPVLILSSEDDRVLGAEAPKTIAKQLAGRHCELYMYKSFGHAAYDTAPDYKERILRFLMKKNEEKT